MSSYYILHKIVEDFLNDIEDQKKHGREYHIYELLEEYCKFYAYWQGLAHMLEKKRKGLRASIYQELRKTEKTQKDAEMKAECIPEYQEHVRKLCEAKTVSLQAYALRLGLETKIDIERQLEISGNTARKYANEDGYGS